MQRAEERVCRLPSASWRTQHNGQGGSHIWQERREAYQYITPQRVRKVSLSQQARMHLGQAQLVVEPAGRYNRLLWCRVLMQWFDVVPRWK